MLPVHCVSNAESLYDDRIQRTLHVPQPQSADHAQWTGEAAATQLVSRPTPQGPQSRRDFRPGRDPAGCGRLLTSGLGYIGLDETASDGK